MAPRLALITILVLALMSFAVSTPSHLFFNLEDQSPIGPPGQEGRLWSLCGDPLSHLLKAYEGGVSISPSQPRVGEELEVTIRGFLESTVASGKINLNLKLMNVIKLNKDLDLCDTLNSDFLRGTPCPLDEGDITLKVTATIPKDVPKMGVKGDITITDQNGGTVTCIRINLKLQ